MKKKIYVGNLPYRFSEDELGEIFIPFGQTEEVIIVRDHQGQSKGFGFVTMESEEAAQSAIEGLTEVQAGGRTLKISLAHSKGEGGGRGRSYRGGGGGGQGGGNFRPRRPSADNYGNY